MLSQVGNLLHHSHAFDRWMHGYTRGAGKKVDLNNALLRVMPNAHAVRNTWISSDESVEIVFEAFGVDSQLLLAGLPDRSLFDFAIAQTEEHVDKIGDPNAVLPPEIQRSVYPLV